MKLPKAEWTRFQASINEWDDSLGIPAPCQPIGCDNEIHLRGCYYDSDWSVESLDMQSLSEKETASTKEEGRLMVILEIDVICTDYSGQPCHLGTFKMEVTDDFFGNDKAYSYARWEHPEVFGSIGYGNIRFRIRTRPKNKPVVEESE